MRTKTLDSCPQDCQRRRVGCRTDCPDWAEHERLKAERYAAKRQEYAAEPDTSKWRKHYTEILRRQVRGQK